VSGIVRHRRRWRRLAVRLAAVGACAALTATLAAALQAHAIRVEGASRFPAADVESSLRFALGTPTVALRADTLRDAARSVPWVADAQVQISIDGVVRCDVAERQPVATAVDGGRRSMLDTEGRLLGEPAGTVPGPELHGFAADAEGRAAALRMVAGAERLWGARLLRAQRLGPRDVLLTFADSQCVALVDPAAPERLEAARRVVAAWTAATQAPPQHVDVRVAGRVALLPAPPAAAAGGAS
jgi:cell division protein FtsQ